MFVARRMYKAVIDGDLAGDDPQATESHLRDGGFANKILYCMMGLDLRAAAQADVLDGPPNQTHHGTGFSLATCATCIVMVNSSKPAHKSSPQ